MLIVIGTTLLMSVDRQYQTRPHKIAGPFKRTIHILFGILFLLIMTNIIAVFLQCGWTQCPDNPTQYELFSVL